MTLEPHTDNDAIASPWRSSIFRSIWIANLASNFGGLIQSVGAAWMMASIAPSADSWWRWCRPPDAADHAAVAAGGRAG